MVYIVENDYCFERQRFYWLQTATTITIIFSKYYFVIQNATKYKVSLQYNYDPV